MSIVPAVYWIEFHPYYLFCPFLIIIASMMFLSSMFWNRYMEHYHMLLEIPIKAETASGNAEKFQLDTLRSATFW